jgi:hypothetical protein
MGQEGPVEGVREELLDMAAGLVVGRHGARSSGRGPPDRVRTRRR